jgi:tetratricopeptide (TPR) repeat protein
VDGVVEGALRKSGDRLRVNIHLVDTKTGFEIWAGDRFESGARDLLETESLLAEAIARQLRGTVLADERALLAKGGTANVDAFDALLRGKQYVYSNVPAESELAQRMFERAIQLDPNFADAYGWLADVLGEQLYGHAKPGQAAAILAAANKALTLDPGLMIARRALIKLYGCDVGQMEETVRQIKLVLAGDRNSIDARDALGYGYFVTGLLDKAIPYYESLVAEEPLNEGFRGTLVWFYWLTGQYEKGIHAWQPLLAEDRGGLWGVALYADQGQFRQAIEAGERHLRKSPADSQEFWAFLGNAYEGAGQHENARRTWAEGARQLEARFSALHDSANSCSLGILYANLNEREKALSRVRSDLAIHPDDSWCASLVYAKLGERVEAFRCMERAAKLRNSTLLFMDVYARPGGPLHALRNDPQFLSVRKQLMRQIEDARVRL